jgi:hypothetical protein
VSGEGEVWDSGKINSDRQLVTYEGKDLTPFTRYYWKVMVWDAWQNESKSDIQSFETGMMDISNWQGNWISDGRDIHYLPAPYFRKKFETDKEIVSARAYIAVAGLYELYINGEKIGNQRLDPMYTRFDRRNLYVIHDVAVEEFIANLTAEYYNYVQQQIRLGNLQYAVSLSKERLRIVEARYQVGSLSQLDLQQAKVDFNADSSLLIQQYEILNSSRIRLNEMMGGDVEQHFLAKDTTILFDASLSKEELFNQAMQHNTVLLLTGKNKTLSELDLKSLRSRNYPYLRLNTAYGFTHYNYNTGTFDRQRTWGPNVGLTLGYTIFDGFNRRREQKNAEITVQNRELQVERNKLALESDFANMWMAYQNNIELTNLELESLGNAELNYEIAMERYKIGDLSGLELREAQNSLLEAEQRLLTAQYNTKLYEISLLQISGKVGEYLE